MREQAGQAARSSGAAAAYAVAHTAAARAAPAPAPAPLKPCHPVPRTALPSPSAAPAAAPAAAERKEDAHTNDTRTIADLNAFLRRWFSAYPRFQVGWLQ